MGRGVGGSKMWGEVREMWGEMWAVGKVRGDVGRSMGVYGGVEEMRKEVEGDVHGLGEV